MKTSDLASLIESDDWMMDILRTVSDLNLPDWWIGAGFVRSKVWDHLHGIQKRTPLPDIDVIYFDPENISEEKEKELEKILTSKSDAIKWSVKNQARMHSIHGHMPYKSSSQALSHWSETATCIGVRLIKNKLIFTAPWETEDLFNLILRPTKDYDTDRSLFNKRIREKNWLKIWPKLKIVND